MDAVKIITLPSGKLFTLRDWTPRKKTAHGRRKERERLGGPGWTKDEFRALCDKHGNVCLCCREPKPLLADHVTPLKRGGRHAIENIQPLCRDCNRRKGLLFTDYRTKE